MSRAELIASQLMRLYLSPSANPIYPNVQCLRALVMEDVELMILNVSYGTRTIEMAILGLSQG